MRNPRHPAQQQHLLGGQGSLETSGQVPASPVGRWGQWHWGPMSTDSLYFGSKQAASWQEGGQEGPETRSVSSLLSPMPERWDPAPAPSSSPGQGVGSPWLLMTLTSVGPQQEPPWSGKGPVEMPHCLSHSQGSGCRQPLWAGARPAGAGIGSSHGQAMAPQPLLSRPPLPTSELPNLSPPYFLFVLLLLKHMGLWASWGLAAWKGGWDCQGPPGVTSLFREALAPKACQGFVLGACVGEKKISKALQLQAAF